MKKNLLFNRLIIAVAAMIFGTAIATAETSTIFSDDFAYATSSDRTAANGIVTIPEDMWKIEGGTKFYSANGALKFNTSSDVVTVLASKSLDLSAAGGVFTVTFKACSWAKDNTKLTIEALDGETSIEKKEQALVVGSAPYNDDKMEVYTMQFTGGTASTILKLKGSKRYFITDFAVTQEIGGTTPTITASDINFGKVNLNTSETKQVAIVGSNLTGEIGVTITGEGFSVTPATLPAAGGDIEVSFIGAEKKAYTGTLTFTSGETVKTINLSAEPIQLVYATIADLKADRTDKTTEFTLSGDVTFVFRNERYMYVKDETGGLQIYDSFEPIITTSYAEGDIIKGGIKGKKGEYNGVFQFNPTANTAASESNTGTVEPKVVTIAELESQYSTLESQLIKITGVTLSATVFPSSNNITITKDENSAVCRNGFKTVTTNPLPTTADVTGLATIFVSGGNTTYQIFPRGNADIVVSTGTSIEKPATASFKAFANNGQITIITDEAGTLEVYSIVGSKVLERAINAETTSFTLQRGAYLIKLNNQVVKVNN